MNGKRTRFELSKDNRVILIAEHLVWGEWLPLFTEDVTDKVMPVVDDHLDISLGLVDYKYVNARLKYTGEDKYQK